MKQFYAEGRSMPPVLPLAAMELTNHGRIWRRIYGKSLSVTKSKHRKIAFNVVIVVFIIVVVKASWM